MSRILVTGGSGFIGTNLISALADQGHELLNYDCEPPVDKRHLGLFVRGNILDADHFRKSICKFEPTGIIHLAARCDLNGKSIEDYGANVQGVQNVVASTRELKFVSRIIFCSSRMVHRLDYQPANDSDVCPFTPYGESKVAGERIVRESNLDCTWLIIRPTSIWGPWFGVPYKGFFISVQKGLYWHPKGEKLYKSFGFVGNAVHQIKSLLSAPKDKVNRRTFYIADYAPIELRDFSELVRQKFGAPRIRELPVVALKTGAIGGDLLKWIGLKNPPLSSFRLKNLRTQMVYDLSSTQDVVGKLPFSLEEGVAQTIKWMSRDL